jgi:hypothetical protein
MTANDVKKIRQKDIDMCAHLLFLSNVIEKSQYNINLALKGKEKKGRPNPS